MLKIHKNYDEKIIEILSWLISACKCYLQLTSCEGSLNERVSAENQYVLRFFTTSKTARNRTYIRVEVKRN